LQFSPETNAKDPDEYLQLHGKTKFGQLLASAKSHIAFEVGLLKNEYNLTAETETNQRIRFTQEAAALIAGLTSAIETDAYAQEISDASGIATSAILAEVHKQRASMVHSEDGQAIILPTPRRPRPQGTIEEKGLREARKGLLSLVLTYPIAARALAMSGYLDPEEIGDETYSRLLILAFRNGESKAVMAPADIIATFENLEDQQKTAEIFASETVYKSNAAIEKALNEMAAIIKQAWFTMEMEALMQKNDLKAVNSLFLTKRNTASLYITMNDG